MDNNKKEYSEFQTKIMRRICANAVISVVAVILIYLFFWRQRAGNWIVWFLESFMQMGHEQAFYLYNDFFRSNKELFFAAAMLFTLEPVPLDDRVF